MDDIYSALIGEAPKGERAALIAAALRRRNELGQLGQITGDKMLAPVGKGLATSADDYATQMQDTRQKELDNAQTQAYQTGQLGHMGGVLAETKRNNDLEHQDRLAHDKMLLEAAGISASSKGGGAKMTEPIRKTILATADAYKGVTDLIGTFKDDYVQILGAGPQSSLPNTAARYGIGTKGSKEAANWWAKFNELRTLPERNRLFGATLSPNEKSEWDKVDLNPNMSPEQIKMGVKRLQEILGLHASNRASGMITEGFNPEVLKAYYGDALPDLVDPQEDDTHGLVDRDASGAAPKKRIKVTINPDGSYNYGD